MGKLLCRLRLHRWHRFNGVLIEIDGKFWGAAYTRRCVRCGKTENASLSL